LLPTPNPFHSENTETPQQWQARRADVKRRTGTMHGPALSVIVQSVLDGMPLLPGHYTPADYMLPTPSTQDAKNLGAESQGRRKSPGLNWVGPALARVPDDLDPPGEQLAIPLPGEQPDVDWGPFDVAVHRWAGVLGRAAPAPVEDGPKGPRLAPRFVEWMMGLPDGWVTDVPGLTYNQQLRALGNGVVPQQAAWAIAELLDVQSWR
jgi:DNA (cytosine-5)-methyltransferase 1